ncbi:unnamed protein product, partial [Ostreobium quekettii]
IIIHIGDGEDCTKNGDLPCSLRESNGSDDRNVGGSRGPVDENPRYGIQKNLEAVEARQRILEQWSSRATMFSLTIEGTKNCLARQLACNNGGAWFSLD